MPVQCANTYGCPGVSPFLSAAATPNAPLRPISLAHSPRAPLAALPSAVGTLNVSPARTGLGTQTPQNPGAPVGASHLLENLARSLYAFPDTFLNHVLPPPAHFLVIRPQPLPSFETFRATNTQDCTYRYTIDKVQRACYSSRCQLKTRFESLAPRNRLRPPAFPALPASLFRSLGPKYLRYFLSFHHFANSFSKTPGWGYPFDPNVQVSPPVPSRNPPQRPLLRATLPRVH